MQPIIDFPLPEKEQPERHKYSPLKSSPAPWKTQKGDGEDADRWLVVADGETPFIIATVENGQPGDSLETEAATAKLIAAAPDLFEALALLEWAIGEERQEAGLVLAVNSPVRQAIRAALLKAKA